METQQRMAYSGRGQCSSFINWPATGMMAEPKQYASVSRATPTALWFLSVTVERALAKKLGNSRSRPTASQTNVSRPTTVVSNASLKTSMDCAIPFHSGRHEARGTETWTKFALTDGLEGAYVMVLLNGETLQRVRREAAWSTMADELTVVSRILVMLALRLGARP